MNRKFTYYFYIVLLLSLPCKAERLFNPDALGGFAISVDMFKYILKTLDIGKTILELGSGSGTGELAKYYKVYSIEHDIKWLNKYPSTYIYAPLKNYNGYYWYDDDVLVHNLPKNYDLILIDGPPMERSVFSKKLALFNTNVPMIFDDVQRNHDLKLLENVAKQLNRSFKIYECSDGKSFGTLNL